MSDTTTYISGSRTATRRYRGRLAPSPTGHLHVGNLATSALAAVRALAADGDLVLRIEDVDLPRTVEGAERAIVDDLRWLGVDWVDRDLQPERRVRQSERSRLYSEALRRLDASGAVYPCFCSRRDIAEAGSAPHGPSGERVYPGTCAGLEPREAWERADREPHAVRFRACGDVEFRDALCGTRVEAVALHAGDFVLRRRDGLWAYQLAVVVDDADSGVTEVVRGRDLLSSTARQVALFDTLGVVAPAWCHVPLMTDERGERLSKRSAAAGRGGLEASGWDGALLCGALACLWGWRDRLAAASLRALSEEWSVGTLEAESLAVPNALFEGPRAFERWLAVRADSEPG
ncbi:MAG: tRNA glutamyl-Q(34) synthetase GluQRS [Myxococcales bacterium]|nr:tRNA glutamyl-Q(34) synthetase GluQRS [Myxococcales bacterium]MCB9531707.1 tRNA glutamyl-Q(34) synthetase GluQRS [Myxococcales bacterium]